MTLGLSPRSLARLPLSVVLVSTTACGPESSDDTGGTGTIGGTTGDADTGGITDAPTDGGATGAPPACDAPPTPTLVRSGGGCGLGFEAAELSIGGVPVPPTPPGPDGDFANRLVGWQPVSHGLTLEFALDSRSFATGLILRGSTGLLQGVRGELVRLGDDVGPQPQAEGTADAAGELVIPLTDIGTGVPYVLTLDSWPPDSCEALSIDIRC